LTITVRPDRGRVLQVTCGGQGVFWTDPDAEGWNIGGDRLWLAPESEWFWLKPDTTDYQFHRVPAPIDPGAWQVTGADPAGWTAVTSGELTSTRSGDTLSVVATRTFTELDGAVPGLREQAAYRIVDQLDVADGPPAIEVSLWKLAQVPPGGVVSIGLTSVGSDTAARVHFEPLQPGDQASHPGRLEVAITADHRWKIGLAAEHVTGRMTYARPTPDGLLVLLRAFAPHPWLPYCDRPHGVEHGDAVQVFNGTPALGGFGEVEHHSPLAANRMGAESVTDASVTVAGLTTADDWPAIRDDWLHGLGPAQLA
jgi:hypothetical protein